jgi:aspartate kinase
MNLKKVVVMKFGGSSVASPERMIAVARYVAEAAKTRGIVAVVSAMGKTTDGLIELARSVAPNAHTANPEFDKFLSTGETAAAALLALTINEFTGKNRPLAESLLGFQLGLQTDARHGGARIQKIHGIERVAHLLNQNRVVVVPGFQGVREGTDQITTFGRGGGDLTPIAIAGELNTKYCEIYTDVDGFFAINPQLVPLAKRFKQISYGQAFQLSVAGAKVLMDRSVLLAQNLGVRIRVLLSPSFGISNGGTLVQGSTREAMEASIVETGLATREATLVKISGIPNKPGKAEKILEALSQLNALESLQGQGTEEQADMSLLFLPKDAPAALSVLSSLKESEGVGVNGMEVAALTLVYPLLPEEPDYLSRAIGALAAAKVNIEMFYKAATTVLLVVRKNLMKRAALALGKEFDLLNPS